VKNLEPAIGLEPMTGAFPSARLPLGSKMAIIAMRSRLREGAMRTVNVADLKDRLSAYLRQVREGEEILIKDRTRPVALIVPLSARNDVDADTAALVASGKARPPKASLSSSFWALPAPRIPIARASGAVSADRDESA